MPPTLPIATIWLLGFPFSLFLFPASNNSKHAIDVANTAVTFVSKACDQTSFGRWLKKKSRISDMGASPAGGARAKGLESKVVWPALQTRRSRWPEREAMVSTARCKSEWELTSPWMGMRLLCFCTRVNPSCVWGRGWGERAGDRTHSEFDGLF